MYEEEKTTQLAAKFIERKGGKMNYLHLLKLMYVADRLSSLRYGVPITFDKWVAMKLGPVLSKTFDIIKESATRDGYWQTYIQKQGYDVALVDKPGDSELSEADQEIIEEVFDQFGGMYRFDVVDFLHTLPEWKPEWSAPDFNSSETMDFEEVLRANEASDEHLAAFSENLAAHRAIASIKGDY